MPSNKTVLTVVVASIVVTTIHYGDNYLNVRDYPQPGWITGGAVILAWILFTFIGIAAYLLYRAGSRLAAGIYLLAYSVAGLSSLGHYMEGPLEAFSLKMHLGMWADGLVGVAVAILGIIVLARRDFDASAPSTHP